MIRSTLLPALLIAAALPSFAAASAPDRPEVYPVCTSPQPIAPVQDAFPIAASPYQLRPALAWNGQEFAMIWSLNNSTPVFSSLLADGTMRANIQPATGVTLTSSSPLDMAWDGTQYGVAVAGRMAGDTFDQIYFYRLTRDGAMIGAPVRVSQTAAAPVSNAANPQLAAVGGRFGIVWNDARAGAQDVYLSAVDADGTLAYADKLLSTGPAAGDQIAPVIAVTNAFSAYQFVVVAWQDFRSTTKWEIYSVAYGLFGGGGIYSGPNLIVSPTAGNSTAPALTSRSNGMGLAWADTRDGGNTEIYFATLLDFGVKLSAETRLTTDAAVSDQPRLVWTGGEYEVAWRDTRTGVSQIFWQRVADDATPVGPNQKLSSLNAATLPAIAWTGTTAGIATFKSGWTQMQFEAFGCSTDVTPPSCSANYLVYGITGSTASISWSPGIDNESGVAYYQVYRNNAAYAKTSDVFFNDSGLDLSTTYNYYVQPVNATQLQNGGCTASVYLKTNATLTLNMGKSAPDALLSWNDAGLNNYNVFRGTDPRVMQQVGQTSALSTQDPGVLANAVSYFYTVDDPGI